MQEGEYTFVTLDSNDSYDLSDAVIIDFENDTDLLDAVIIDENNTATTDIIFLSDETIMLSDADMFDISSFDMELGDSDITFSI